MKKYMLNAPKQAGLDAMYSLFAEMVLEESIRTFRKEQLKKEIDHSLERGDKDAFLRLTRELKMLA